VDGKPFAKMYSMKKENIFVRSFMFAAFMLIFTFVVCATFLKHGDTMRKQ